MLRPPPNGFNNETTEFLDPETLKQESWAFGTTLQLNPRLVVSTGAAEAQQALTQFIQSATNDLQEARDDVPSMHRR